MCRQQCTGFFPAALQIFVPGVFTLNILLYSIQRYCVFSQLLIAKASILWANQSRESKHSAIWINGIIHSCKWMSQERWKKHLSHKPEPFPQSCSYRACTVWLEGIYGTHKIDKMFGPKCFLYLIMPKAQIFSLSAKIKICTLSMQGSIPSLTTSHKK